jgi:hypothetical protein
MSGITTTFAPHASALTPNARDLAILRAALAYLIALLFSPIRRIVAAEREARLERLALAARRNAMLNRSAPSGCTPIPLASVPVAPIAPVQDVGPAGAVPSACDADGWYLVVLTAAEPTAPTWHDGQEPAAPPAAIDPPAAPAPRKRKAPAQKKTPAVKKTPAKKAPAPRKSSVKKAANPPAEPPTKTPRKRRAAPAADAAEPTKTPRKRKTAAK